MFITVPIKLFFTEPLSGKETITSSTLKFDSSQLEYYNESYDPDFPDEAVLCVGLKSSKSFLVYLSIESFEKLLNISLYLRDMN